MLSPSSRLARLPSVVRAAAWMTGTLASFLAMAVAIRELSADMSTYEILFFRAVVGALILMPAVVRQRGRAFHSARPMLQITRAVVLFAATYGWMLALALLPMVEVFALEFTAPIWVTLLAAVLLREGLTVPRIVAVAGGFTGVLIILRPGIAVFDPLSLVPLAAALGFASGIIMTKVLTRTDSATTIIVYITAVHLPLATVFAAAHWTAPSWANLPWILVAGGTGLSAQYAMARALEIADASVIHPIDFLRVPLVAVVGILFYREVPDVWVLVGGLVIFGANYFVVWRETKRREGRATARTAA